MNAFKALGFKVDTIGYHKTYTWNILLDELEFKIELVCYYLSNRRIVLVNGTENFNGTKPLFKDFFYSFNIGRHVVMIENSKKATDVVVDCVSFYQIFNFKITTRMYSQSEEHKSQVFYHDDINSQLNHKEDKRLK
jgi:hypothetical protein